MFSSQNLGPGAFGAVLSTALTFLLTLPPAVLFGVQIVVGVTTAVLSALAVRKLNRYLDRREKEKAEKG